MGSPQIIVAPNGEELVVIPRADYEALIAAAAEAAEEAADRAVYDERKSALLRDADAPLPAAVSAGLLAGQRLPAALRLWRGFSIDDLAGRAGVAPARLASIENGAVEATAQEKASLAAALGAPAAWLA